MKGTNIGEFEELVLLTIGNLYPEAYGVSIKNALMKKTGRKLTLSSVHAALVRLEDKGYCKSSFGEATPARGGKRKKLFEITVAGFKALEESRELRNRMWNGFSGKLIQKLS